MQERDHISSTSQLPLIPTFRGFAVFVSPNFLPPFLFFLLQCSYFASPECLNFKLTSSESPLLVKHLCQSPMGHRISCEDFQSISMQLAACFSFLLDLRLHEVKVVRFLPLRQWLIQAEQPLCTQQRNPASGGSFTHTVPVRKEDCTC